MLSIQPLKSAKAAADYYTAAFNYYSGDATAMEWLGQGSKALQLTGLVQKEQMLALLEGKLPNGQVLQNFKGEHRPGFDMTFSAPKSVSVLVGLGVAPELVQFHDTAVKKAIQQIEREFAQTRVSRHGDIAFEKTGNLLVAAFRQPSSRANDPALHTHCVTLNMTFHEGKARSLASDVSRNHGVIEQIQNNAHYCGLIYRQHLANQLKEAGFHLRLSGDGLFEIDGVPEGVLQEFSRRREDIERLLEDKGWSGAKSASAATMLTRHNKEEQAIELLEEDWKQRAQELGFDAKAFIQNRHQLRSPSWFLDVKEKLLALVRKNKQNQSSSEMDAARACVQVSIETLSQRTSVFTERELLTQVMKHSLVYPEVITQKTMIAAIQEERKSQSLYEVRCQETGQWLFTTPWLLTVETETLARIEHNKGAVPAIATKEKVKAFQKERSVSLPYPMTNSQKESMMALLTSKDRYFAIQGYAGVAKTSMLSEARLLIEEQGYQLRGITVASSAAHELQIKAGIKTDVFPLVHQELRKAPTASLTKSLFIVDEASMLSSHQGHELLKQIERTGARLVLVGDKAQLPSVNTGRIFGLTQEYGIETTVMDEIVRQKNQTLKEAVIAATKGEVKEAVDKLDVKTLTTHEGRIHWIAHHWLSLTSEQRDETLLFAPTHANREAITRLLREGLKQEGVLKEGNYTQTVLKAKTIESVQQRFVAYYQKGDVVRFNADFKKYSIQSGHYYTVGEISKKIRQDNILPLIDGNGRVIKFSLKHLPHYKTHSAPFERVIELYQPKQLELLVGDKIMWTRNFKGNEIRNGQCATLQEINEKSFVFTTKEGNQLILEKSHPALKHLDYSYVLTNYKVQGKDAPYGIGLMESYHRFGATLKNFYVQISRAIHGMTLVTDNKEELVCAIRRNTDEKKSSLDMTPTSQLIHHEKRFSHQDKLSIQSVIDKKAMLESPKISNSINQRISIDDFSFVKSSKPELNKQLIKELEL
ncbi:TPA: conjugative relaxase [Legionella pneumophila]|nr:conjugative relaxase [Legionella pneumophila]